MDRRRITIGDAPPHGPSVTGRAREPVAARPSSRFDPLLKGLPGAGRFPHREDPDGAAVEIRGCRRRVGRAQAAGPSA